MKPTSLFLAAAALALSLAACGGPAAPSSPQQPSLTPPATACSAAGSAASDAAVALDPTVQTACVLTSQGEFVLSLDTTAAPATVENFLWYVTTGFYDQTVLHRVIAGFVAQGGGVDVDSSYRLAWKLATRPAIALERTGLSNLRYTIAMARLGGADTDTATSQFFVNVADNHACLDPDTAIAGCDPSGYAVFGEVISGRPTIDEIATVPTTADAIPYPLVIVYWAKQLR